MSTKPPHIVVTGANGFIGTHVMHALAEAGEYPVGLCRRPTKGLVHGFDLNAVGDLSSVLAGAKAVVHCAARVHGKDDKTTALTDHTRANTEATAELIKQAEAAGVKRFIMLSTVAVYGLESSAEVLSLDHPVNPQTPYAVSKLEAEGLVSTSQMQSTILRVPQVYGPHAPGVWGKLMRMANSPYPLPFDFVGNRRSMIAARNLADLIRYCVTANSPPDLMLATDGLDIGTTEIFSTLRQAFGRPRRLFTMPLPMMRAISGLVRRPYLYEFYYGSLRFEAAQTDWTPPVSPQEALKACVPIRKPG